jgi:hypothetical protein
VLEDGFKGRPLFVGQVGFVGRSCNGLHRG